METNRKRQIAILGSTGSIGTQTLQVVEEHPECFEVYAITAGTRVNDLIEQARKFLPRVAIIADETKYQQLKEALADLPIKAIGGYEAICEVVQEPAIDVVVTAMVGFSGLRPTIAAIKAGKEIALANKETLVVGGDLVMRLAAERRVPILPIDSEHSAIFQCLEMNNPLEKVILTASGGPFRTFTKEQLEHVTKEQALKHPNWDMGNKITIDSATLMNKGLEFIEAKWLFDLEPEQIDIVVHRQSIIHSAVEYKDYAVIAQLGVPDMKIPIQYSLLYPERVECPTKPLSLTDYGTLTFAEPDYKTFKCLSAAIDAISRGGAYPCLVNSANEEAVKAFLNDEIKFIQIGEIVSSVLEKFPYTEIKCYEDVTAADAAAREYVRGIIG